MKFLAKLFLFLTIFFSGFYAASAFTGEYFDYSVTGQILTMAVHDPYLTRCDIFGSALPFIYQIDGSYIEGDTQCTFLGLDKGFTDYKLVLWLNNDVEGFSPCADFLSYDNAVVACSGIMTPVQVTLASVAGASLVVIDASIASFSVIGTSSASDMIAGVASGVRDTGVNLWVVVASAISLFFIFWVIENVISLFPDEKVTRPTSRKRK